ncbi:hypothetical protein PoB_005517800 [Plakobranchus ocellatus]|uniref:Uncharacterized protein n=1 Tax=Plakobranchus ocellatus TaxID=259542 RepID=A0AAV4C9W7_9GAST|nr:hypothetical protein PoB_005517800 [Plakobranchus ocellatus]
MELSSSPHTADIADPDLADTNVADRGVAEPFAVPAVRVLLFQFLAYPKPLVLPEEDDDDKDDYEEEEEEEEELDRD